MLGIQEMTLCSYLRSASSCLLLATPMILIFISTVGIMAVNPLKCSGVRQLHYFISVECHPGLTYIFSF